MDEDKRKYDSFLHGSANREARGDAKAAKEKR